MKTVKDVMTRELTVMSTDTTITEAARCMRDDDIGDVLIAESGTLRGIVTDRDLVVRALADGKDPDSLTLGECCSSDLRTCGPDDDVGDVIAIMREHNVRRVPVVDDDGTAVGILSLGDLAMERDEESVLADISAAPQNN